MDSYKKKLQEKNEYVYDLDGNQAFRSSTAEVYNASTCKCAI